MRRPDQTEFVSALWDRVEARRNEIGMSENELKRRTGYSARESRSAGSEPGAYNLLSLARELSVSPHYLMGLTDELGPANALATTPASRVAMLCAQLRDNDLASIRALREAALDAGFATDELRRREATAAALRETLRGLTRTR